MLKTMAIVRPINLIIILLTMIVVQSNIYAHAGQETRLGFQWWLKLLIMLILAASGNVINDIWDQKVDAINKGSKQLIGRVITPLQAKRLYGILIFFLFILSFQIYLVTQKAVLIYVPLAMAVGLYIYTPVLKRFTWVGNIWVSACIGFVPLWVTLGKWNWTFHSDIFIRIFFLALMAFFVNWIREIVKDMMDAQGDRQCGYQSLSIAYGNPFAIKVVRFLLCMLFLVIGGYIFLSNQRNGGVYVAIILLWIPCGLLLWKTTKFWNKVTPKKVSFFLKSWMLLALIQFFCS
jgi:4-hydroxybenzoate polyprenyltransferase